MDPTGVREVLDQVDQEVLDLHTTHTTAHLGVPGVDLADGEVSDQLDDDEDSVEQSVKNIFLCYFTILWQKQFPALLSVFLFIKLYSDIGISININTM